MFNLINKFTDSYEFFYTSTIFKRLMTIFKIDDGFQPIILVTTVIYDQIST